MLTLHPFPAINAPDSGFHLLRRSPRLSRSRTRYTLMLCWLHSGAPSQSHFATRPRPPCACYARSFRQLFCSFSTPPACLPAGSPFKHFRQPQYWPERLLHYCLPNDSCFPLIRWHATVTLPACALPPFSFTHSPPGRLLLSAPPQVFVFACVSAVALSCTSSQTILGQMSDHFALLSESVSWESLLRAAGALPVLAPALQFCICEVSMPPAFINDYFLFCASHMRAFGCGACFRRAYQPGRSSLAVVPPFPPAQRCQAVPISCFF